MGSAKKPSSSRCSAGAIHTLVSWPSSAGLPASEVNTTVASSGASISTPATFPETGPSSSWIRSIEATTSAEVTGVPSENTASSRRVNSHSVASSETVHSAASSGS